jgi:hypothetical protein
MTEVKNRSRKIGGRHSSALPNQHIGRKVRIAWLGRGALA